MSVSYLIDEDFTLNVIEDNLETDSKKLVCPVCGFQATTIAANANHVNSCKGKNKVFCPMCDYETALYPHMYQHMHDFHTNERIMYSSCSYETTLKNLMETHLKQHEKRKSSKIKGQEQCISCNLCEFKTVSDKKMKKHIDSHHHKCSACGYETMKLGDFIKHRSSHLQNGTAQLKRGDREKEL